jgi:pentatricopeptide repeat protein
MALEMLAEMRALGLTPNVITYNALISTLARAGRQEAAFAVREVARACTHARANL